MDNAEKIIASLVEKVERRFYGKYRGLVVNNADPERLGRLKLQVPSVLGDNVVTGWAMPCVPYGGGADQGMLFIPEVGAGVWVEFEEGDLEFPIWVGTYWSKPGGNSELPKPNDPQGKEQSSVQSPPTRKIIKTNKGHTIQLEDSGVDERIIISDGQSENRIVFSKNGIAIENKNNSVTITDQSIVIQDKNSNKLIQDGNGIVIEDKNGNKLTMDAKSGGIPGTAGVKINGDKKVCLEGLITWLLGHTHIGNLGAPCPLSPADISKLNPVLTNPDGSILSKSVKLG